MLEKTTDSFQFLNRVSAGIGVICMLPVAMAIVSLLVPLYFHESIGIQCLLITTLAGIPSGFFIFLGRKEIKYYENFSLIQMMTIVTGGWTFASLIGAIPFYYFAQYSASFSEIYALDDFLSFSSCFFESTSGFTSTGLTMSGNPDQLPQTLQFWRSFMQWIGGAGLLIFISTMLRSRSIVLKKYYQNDNASDAFPSVSFSYGKVGMIYISLTVLVLIAFMLQGVAGWEALNHSLSGISTGGFTITADSMRSYPAHLKVTAMIVTVIGALNFNLFGAAWKFKSPGLIFSDGQVKAFLVILAFAAAFICIENYVDQRNVAVIDGIFQAISALGTAGFQSSDLNLWSPFALVTLVVFMLIGGNSGSTTSGIKTFRFISLLKGGIHYVKALFVPNRSDRNFIPGIGASNGEESMNIYRHVVVFIFIFVSTFLVLVTAGYYLLPAEYPLAQKVFEIGSAFNNVGLSSGMTGSDLSLSAKGILIFGMIVGRIELIPIYLFIFLFVNNQSKIN